MLTFDKKSCISVYYPCKGLFYATLALEFKGPKGDTLSISAKHLIKHILFIFI